MLTRFETQQKFSAASSELLETIIQSKDKRISDLIILFAFSNLLLVPKKPIEFIEQGGLDQLKVILERSESKIKTNYYGLLCYWILSYEEKFISYASTPSVSPAFPFNRNRQGFSLLSLQWSRRQEEKK